MVQTRGKNFARVLALSLVLGGLGGWPQARAAGLDTTATVTAGGGTYNSIKVSNAEQSRYWNYIYGIYNNEVTPIQITMDGEKIITVTDTGVTDDINKSASAIGIRGAEVIGEGVQLTVQATGGTAESAFPGPYVSAYAYAYGVSKNSTVGDNAVITVTAIGGKATASSGDAETIAYAYGVQGSNTVGDNAVITVTANGGEAKAPNAYAYAYAYAYGVHTGGGVNTLQGAAKIISKAEVQTSGSTFGAWSLYAAGENNDKTGTNNLIATGKTKILEGDVKAISYGINNLVLVLESA